MPRFWDNKIILLLGFLMCFGASFSLPHQEGEELDDITTCQDTLETSEIMLPPMHILFLGNKDTSVLNMNLPKYKQGFFCIFEDKFRKKTKLPLDFGVK